METLNYFPHGASVKNSRQPLRLWFPLSFFLNHKQDFTSQVAFGQVNSAPALEGRVLHALTTPPLFYRRHFFRDFHPAATGLFFLKEKRQLKKFPPFHCKTWQRWGQKGHIQESGTGVEAEERRGYFRGLRKDRKSPCGISGSLGRQVRAQPLQGAREAGKEVRFSSHQPLRETCPAHCP